MSPFTESSTLNTTVIENIAYWNPNTMSDFTRFIKEIFQQLKGRFAHTIFFTVFSCDVKCLLNTRPFWGVYISFFLWCSLCKLVHWQMLCFLGPLTWTVCFLRGEDGRWEEDGGSQWLQKEGTDCSLVCIFSYCGCVLPIVHHILQTSTAGATSLYWICSGFSEKKKKKKNWVHQFASFLCSFAIN